MAHEVKRIMQDGKSNMEKTSEHPVPLAPSLQQTGCWYRAATLAERLISWSAKDAAHILHENGRKEEVEKVIQHWKAQKPFDKDSFFADRLMIDSLSEQDLLALLAEPVEALEKRLSFPSVPNWVTELMNALQSDSLPLPVPEQNREHFVQRFAMFQPFYPLLQKDITRLQTGIAALSQQYDTLPFDPVTILSLLLPHLFQQIGSQVSKTLVLELHVARLRGHLQGETSEARFRNYLDRLSEREPFRSLLEEYVVLARQVMVTSRLWADCSLEFVHRLCADWLEILSVLQPEKEPGVLTGVAGGAGDTHRGGHSVMILTFCSGWQLVYKPKSLTIDVHFQELLGWLNACGSHPAFRLLKLLDKGTYGWSEFVAASECSSEVEVARFYERQGGYLALLYALEGTDSHYENVIAVGEHPLLIDLESLFQHRQRVKDAQALSPAQQFLRHSVIRSLLLPSQTHVNEEGEGIDISGLAQVKGQLTPYPVPLWEGIGTDEMKLIRKRIELQGSHNCPRLHDQEVQPLDYLDHIISGFTAIYKLLLTYRDDIVTSWLPRFAHDEIRFVARATQTYSILLTESFHPNMLRDALKRERLFDRLWLGVEYQPSLSRLIPAERADLLRGDIPMFTTYPQSRDLWTSQGERLPDFFPEPSLELVRQRLLQFSNEDMQRQIWVIRASFANLAAQRATTAKAADANLLPTTRTYSPVGREHLLAEARAIGDRLCENALQEEGADWIGLILINERDWQISPVGLDLYNGLSGIVLFLSYLGQITGEARYMALAQAGLKTVRTFLQQNQTFLEHTWIGAFVGPGSYLYLLAHLAILWDDPSLLKEAEELAQQLSGQIEKDEQYDLVDGAAGYIACLLTLYAVAPSEQVLKMAMQCSDHLLAHAQQMSSGLGWKAQWQDIPLSGFSHGAAGIAWSLLRLAAVSGEERFQEAAKASLAYERSLFSPEQHNWLDLRKRSTSSLRQHDQATEPVEVQEARYGMSWSHGAPGIALGRLVSLQYLDDARIRTELEMALETTLADGFGFSHEQVGPNHSLAYGDCGNLETVLLAVQTLHISQLHEHLERLTAQVLESIHRHGWVMGTPLHIETPGLMLGLAGIGYQCLRLAEPERVPSVLTLAPPPVTMGL